MQIRDTQLESIPQSNLPITATKNANLKFFFLLLQFYYTKRRHENEEKLVHENRRVHAISYTHSH